MNDRFSCRPLWKLMPALSLIGCGNIVLQTTSEPEQNSFSLNSDAGVVSDTFFVSGPTLFDPCGQPVVLRGVNEMVTFTYQSKDGSAYLGEIAKTGANSIRIYWTTNDTKDDLERLLTNTEKNKLIPIIYVFNYQLGPSTVPIPTTVSQAADFWTRSDILPIVLKHQQWLIIALREKDLPATESLSDWGSNYDTQVKRLRDAAINVPLAIDAPNYGLDIGNLAQSGQARIDADPRRNLLLNTNAWWTNVTADVIRSNITTVTNASLPLLIGEFSDYAQYPNCTSLIFDYSTLIQVAQETGSGWEAWSWGAARNTQPCSTLDMTTDQGKFDNLSPWGREVALTNGNSIQRTSAPAKFTPGRGCQGN